MTLQKAIERLTLHENSEIRLRKLFDDLGDALTEWNNATDKYREEEAKRKYRKIRNSILMITNNESNYDVIISDILSCDRQVVAYPNTTESRSFTFGI